MSCQNLFKMYKIYSHETESNTFSKSTLKTKRTLFFVQAKFTTSLTTKTPSKKFIL